MSTFSTWCFYSLKGWFFFLEYCKTHFPCLYCQKKSGKMGISGPKPLVNQFQNNLSFSTCGSFYFYRLESRFFVLEYRKTHFSSPCCQKKKSWKNVNFSPLRTSCFYSLERRLFVLKYHKRHFPDLYCLAKKVG